MELDAQPAPYHSSTKEQPLPRVVAYSPALTMRVITQEQRNMMLVNLMLVCRLASWDLKKENPFDESFERASVVAAPITLSKPVFTQWVGP